MVSDLMEPQWYPGMVSDLMGPQWYPGMVSDLMGPQWYPGMVSGIVQRGNHVIVQRDGNHVIVLQLVRLMLGICILKECNKKVMSRNGYIVIIQLCLYS